MTDPDLMRGDGWVRCCLCGKLHTAPYDGLYVDAVGDRWDACSTCAIADGWHLGAVDGPAYEWRPDQG